VSPVTIRNVQTRLEEEGLISRQVGRGTFVLAPTPPSVVVVDDEIQVRLLVSEYVSALGYRPLEAASPDSALALLERERGVVLILCDVRMPDRHAGIEFIRTVRRRWPAMPIAAVTGYPDDLAELHGTADCPALVVMKPVRRSQIEEALARLPGSAAPVEPRLPVLIVDDDSNLRDLLHQMIAREGHEVEEASSGSEALIALRRRQFGHILLDLHMPGGGMETAAAIARAHPDTVVVLMTGYPEEVIGSPGGPWLLLTKPFHNHDVQQTLRLRRQPAARSA
jgi:two-component system response regulator (stage 0 sporulation protein F)